MAAFRAAERDVNLAMTQFGKDDANAAVNRMAMRLEKLKALQVSSEEERFTPKNSTLASLLKE